MRPRLRVRCWAIAGVLHAGARLPAAAGAVAELLLLEEPQTVLELRGPELELLELAAGDEAELAERAGQRDARPLPDTLRVAAPARREVSDQLPGLVGAHASAPGELFDELLDALACQRHCAYRGQREPLGGIAQRRSAASGLVHEASSAAAVAGGRASTPQPAGRPARTRAARQAAVRRRRRRPRWAPAPRPRARPRQASASPAAARTPARAPSASRTAAPRRRSRSRRRR